MLKIKYKEDYLSIKKFEPIEMENFSILTGINGSGKTHFIQGIAKGNFTVENIETDKIKYFDYSSFATINANEKLFKETEELIQKIKNQIENKKITENNLEYKYFFDKAKEKSKSVSELNIEDFKESREKYAECNEIPEDISYIIDADIKERLKDSKYNYNINVLKYYDNIPSINKLLNDLDIINYRLSIDHYKLGEETLYKYNIINNNTNLELKLEDLSSGEKILICLAVSAYKLNKKSNNIKLLLLDEIDALLHPSMIKQITEKIKTIFVEKYKIKVILVTHSPTAVTCTENIYTIKRDEVNTMITKVEKEDAVTELAEGIIVLEYAVNNILTIFTNDNYKSKDIIIFSEGTNYKYLEKLLELYNLEDNVTVLNKKNLTSGDLKNLYKLFISMRQNTKTVFFVWDCDYEFKNIEKENNKKNIPYILPSVEGQKLDRGIEASFSQESLKIKDTDLEEKIDNKKNRLGFGVIKKKEAQKNISKLTKEDFEKFEDLIKKINSKLPNNTKNITDL